MSALADLLSDDRGTEIDVVALERGVTCGFPLETDRHVVCTRNCNLRYHPGKCAFADTGTHSGRAHTVGWSTAPCIRALVSVDGRSEPAGANPTGTASPRSVTGGGRLVDGLWNAGRYRLPPWLALLYLPGRHPASRPHRNDSPASRARPVARTRVLPA